MTSVFATLINEEEQKLINNDKIIRIITAQLVLSVISIFIYFLNAIHEFLRILNCHFISIKKVFVLDAFNGVFGLIIVIIERVITDLN